MDVQAPGIGMSKKLVIIGIPDTSEFISRPSDRV